MANALIGGVRIDGIITAVPRNEVALAGEAAGLGIPEGQLARLKKTIGLDRRRIAPPEMTASDLAEAAAKRLLADCACAPEDIDGIFMVTQTPDYLQPGNAVLLQDRLGLPKSTAAMDLNLGCSGYVYGLWTVASLLRAGGLRRVLLLVGDTVSRIVHEKDRALRPLFGDAVAATLLTRDEEEGVAPMRFDLCSDGSGYKTLYQPGGAFRAPWTPERANPRDLGEGIIRSPCHLHMDGAAIFNFSLKVEPPAIEGMLAASGWSVEDVDGFVFHQANRYILQNIRRRLKLPAAKVPDATVEKYGNQSGASIPGTLCDHYGTALCERSHRMIWSGFGVGLSWATCAVQLPALRACGMVEV
ncbi:MAG: ketoacyl-ACP synthase III [Verrucomicrobia bacterium]|jgi:3-oxoacyl-[acyl-carrier-protein] synthase-3|nr:ketoacyl-ACP synthase III [Verrucomicrobiota bacterium]